MMKSSDEVDSASVATLPILINNE